MSEFDCPRMPEGPFNYGKARWRDNQTCSHCGSLSSDVFLQAVADGAVITPTDKNYKAYLDLPGRPHAKVYFQHLSDAQQHEFIRLYNEGKMKIGAPGRFYVTPFFCARVAKN